MGNKAKSDEAVWIGMSRYTCMLSTASFYFLKSVQCTGKYSLRLLLSTSSSSRSIPLVTHTQTKTNSNLPPIHPLYRNADDGVLAGPAATTATVDHAHTTPRVSPE